MAVRSLLYQTKSFTFGIYTSFFTSYMVTQHSFDSTDSHVEPLQHIHGSLTAHLLKIENDYKSSANLHTKTKAQIALNEKACKQKVNVNIISIIEFNIQKLLTF
jgi:hypothetical protein